MALITQKDIDDIKAALVEVAPFTEEPITYRRYRDTTPGDPTLGLPDTLNFIDKVTSAMVRWISAEDVAKSGGTYVLGDMEFSIRMAEKPGANDRIIYQGLTWKPRSPHTIDKAYLGEVLWWTIIAKRE